MFFDVRLYDGRMWHSYFPTRPMVTESGGGTIVDVPVCGVYEEKDKKEERRRKKKEKGGEKEWEEEEEEEEEEEWEEWGRGYESGEHTAVLETTEHAA